MNPSGTSESYQQFKKTNKHKKNNLQENKVFYIPPSELKGCPPRPDPPPWRSHLPESPPSVWTARPGPSWAGCSGPGAATACAGGSSSASTPGIPDPPCARTASPRRSDAGETEILQEASQGRAFRLRGAAVMKLNTSLKLGARVCHIPNVWVLGLCRLGVYGIK